MTTNIDFPSNGTRNQVAILMQQNQSPSNGHLIINVSIGNSGSFKWTPTYVLRLMMPKLCLRQMCPPKCGVQQKTCLHQQWPKCISVKGTPKFSVCQMKPDMMFQYHCNNATPVQKPPSLVPRGWCPRPTATPWRSPRVDDLLWHRAKTPRSGHLA